MSEQANHVVVVDLKMPFWSMVVFMVKWAIAAIPAILILYLIGMTLIVAVPSAITGYSGYTQRAKAALEPTAAYETCVEKGLRRMGSGHSKYVEDLCKGDPKVSERW